MTRDTEDRLEMLTEYHGVEVQRLALNWDQIEQYRPPPNFAKTTDSRAAAYIAEFGNDSWELDAMEPQVLADLVRGAIDAIRDQDMWDEDEDRKREDRKQLSLIRENWGEVIEHLNNGR